MTKKIELREVTRENWEEVADLELLEAQEDYVASNLYSLAEAKFDPHAVPRAIYAGKRLVGFMMWKRLADEGHANEVRIYRFMIDRRQQSKGYGRRALQTALKEIGRRPDVARISISYLPDNAASKRLYDSLGFVEAGLDEHGEMIAVLDAGTPGLRSGDPQD